MIDRKVYENGVRLSTLDINQLGVEINVIGAGLKADGMAYLMACISRYKKSMKQLVTRTINMPTEKAEERITEIIEGYGHGSVRSLGHTTCNMDGLSILHTMQAFNQCPLQDGQERSTRYVDISDTQHKDDEYFVPIELKDHPDLRREFIQVMDSWMSEYKRSLEVYTTEIQDLYREGDDVLSEKVARSRALDCARYFIPLGARSTLVLNQSGTEWVSLISLLSSSLLKGDRLIGSGLEEILVSTEGGRLIKHVNRDINKVNRKALDYVRSQPGRFTEWSYDKGFMKVSKNGLPLEWAYSVLDNPLISDIQGMDFQLHNALMNNTNRHEGLDIRASRVTSGMTCWGMTDLGTLKDLNRHRGMFYIPLLMEGFDVIRSASYYSVPPYIESGRLKHLDGDYTSAYDRCFKGVEQWFFMAQEVLGNKVANEIVKYLLPHCFNTPYCVSGDIRRWHYLLNLREGWGGHISYRKWAYDCNELWKKEGYNFVPNIKKPDPNSIEELQYRN